MKVNPSSLGYPMTQFDSFPSSRITRRALFTLILGASLDGQSCLAGGDTTGISSLSSPHLVPVRLGTVDATRGNLSLTLPLGPRIPGRLPTGLVWHFDSQDAVQFRIGGAYQAVRWPVGSVHLDVGKASRERDNKLIILG